MSNLHHDLVLHFEAVDPVRSIADLPLLTESEKARLQAWNDTATDYTADKCIHELFEEQVVKTPDAIAVVFETQKNCLA